jgi:hypothetical protein
VKKKFADQKDAEQLNISVPRSLIEVLRPISQQVDLEFYKVLLVGLDAFVRDNRHTITPELYEAYRRLRNSLWWREFSLRERRSVLGSIAAKCASNETGKAISREMH